MRRKYNRFSTTMVAIWDKLIPNARYILINIDTPESLERSIQLARSFGVITESEILREMFQGYNEGLSWVLRKFNYTRRPAIMILIPKRPLLHLHGYIQSHDAIFIDKYALDEFVGANLTKYRRVIQDEVSDMYLTLRQHCEGLFVEEGTHFLAAHQVMGLAAVPDIPKNSASWIKYHSDLYEFDGLVQRGEFFKEKYGINPLEPLEKAVREYMSTHVR